MKEDTKFAVDCVIDAITNLTAMDNREIDENAKMFLSFLKEEKYKGVHCFHDYLNQRARGFACIAATSTSSDWKEYIYKNEFFQKYAEEFANWKTNKE